MSQKYVKSIRFYGEPVFEDILKRKQKAYPELRCPDYIRFYYQGDFTVCAVAWEGRDPAVVVGVAKRNTGDKKLVKLAERMEDIGYKDGANDLRRLYSGDPQRVQHGQRMAYSRALDNAMKGSCR